MLLITVGFAFLWQRCEQRCQAAGKTFYENKTNYLLLGISVLGTFLPMYLVNSCMSFVGNDYINYYRYYQNIAAGREQDVDIAYKLINIFVIRAGLDFQWVYFITCFLAYGLLILCIWKYSKNYALSYLLFFFGGYFFLLGLNQIRQFVSMGMILWGIQYIQNRKFWKYLVCVCIAGLFHFTAFIMIPFYFILNKKIKFSMYFVISMCALPINFFLTDILTFLFKTFLPRYLQSNYISKTYSLNVPYLTMILMTTVVTLILVARSPKERCDEKNRVYFNGVMIGAVIAMFCTWIPEYQRFVYYFFMGEIFFLPNLLKTEESRWKKILLILIVIAADMVYLVTTAGEMNVLTYRSIF